MVMVDMKVSENLSKELGRRCKNCMKHDVCYFNRSVSQTLNLDEKNSGFNPPFRSDDLANICKYFIERLIY